MSTPKRTPWFHCATEPARTGVYFTRVCGAGESMRGFSYWNGNSWSPRKRTVADAMDTRYARAAVQRKDWQGITKPAR